MDTKIRNNKCMNRIIIAIFVILGFQVSVHGKSILEKPTVNKRTELLSIVFRLAEKPEYSSEEFKLYSDRVERYFGKYKDHELIQFTKSIMYKNWIGYAQVMSMAIHLDDQLELLTGVKDVWEYTGWKKEDVEKFVLLLQQFNKDTKFDDFFKENSDIYAEVAKRSIPIYEKMDLGWFRSFYGNDPKETFAIIIGLGNWNANYAASLDYTNGNKNVYAVMGIWRIDSTGMPEINASEYLPIIVHEFSHLFAPQIPENSKDHPLRGSGEKIFSVVKDEMINQAYPLWEPMFNEAIVRAAVIKYMKDHDFEKSEIENEIKLQKTRGFIWIEELVGELESYDRQRNQYQTLNDYMPKLIEAYKIWAENIQTMDDKRPKAISISEFDNGSQSVNADIKIITVNFNMPLSGKGHSIYPFQKGMDAFPKIEAVNYASDNRSVRIEVNLEKSKEYQFVLVGENYTSTDGIGMKMYEVNFKTEK